MKKFKFNSAGLRGYIAGILSAVLLLSVPAFAESIYTTIDVLVNQVRIVINGEEKNIDSFVYNGSTYVPLRAYSELLDKSVDYNAETQTITVQDREQALIMSKEIAFLVNGEAVRVSHFKQMFNWFKYNLGIEEMDEGTYAEFKEFVKQETVANCIVHQYAADVGIHFGGAEENAIRKRIEIYANNFGGMDSFKKKLNDIGITYDFYYWLQKTALLKDRLADIVIDPVTETDIIDYYYQNSVLYTKPYMQAKHIFFSTTDDAGYPLSQSVCEQKRKDAEDVWRAVVADPTGFDAMMQQYSEDPGLAHYPNGYAFTTGEMVKAFESATLVMKPGEISKVIESELGYHIILLVDREVRYTPIEDVQESIANSLRNERYYKELEPQIQSAYILLNGDVYDSL